MLYTLDINHKGTALKRCAFSVKDEKDIKEVENLIDSAFRKNDEVCIKDLVHRCLFSEPVDGIITFDDCKLDAEQTVNKPQFAYYTSSNSSRSMTVEFEVPYEDDEVRLWKDKTLVLDAIGKFFKDYDGVYKIVKLSEYEADYPNYYVDTVHVTDSRISQNMDTVSMNDLRNKEITREDFIKKYSETNEKIISQIKEN